MSFKRRASFIVSLIELIGCLYSQPAWFLKDKINGQQQSFLDLEKCQGSCFLTRLIIDIELASSWNFDRVKLKKVLR